MTSLYLLVFLSIALGICSGKNLYTDIYRTLDAYPCILLLDKNGPVGCNAPEDGVVGDLHVVQTQSELDAFIADPPGDSKAIAMPPSLFNKNTVTNLHGTKKLKGILLLSGPPPTAGWSPDTKIPNEQWGVNPTTPTEWNTQGDGLNFIKIPVPVYALSENESSTILSLATNDTSFPRHAVRFNTFMHATMNAETCLRRSQCIPLGGKSVWSSFNEVGSKPMIMAMANMDSAALFHDLAVGADSTVSGIVGLLGSALALQTVNKTGFTKDIVFAFWAGESWGYMGSRKFVDDIQNFNCKKADTERGTCDEPYKIDLSFTKIKLDNIESAFEFNQIGLSDVLYSHPSGSQSADIASLLQTVSLAANLDIETGTPLPPSSSMSFLRAKPTLPNIVITDHETAYANKNFHSQFDNGIYNPLSNKTICSAATSLAQTLYLYIPKQIVELYPLIILVCLDILFTANTILEQPCFSTIFFHWLLLKTCIIISLLSSPLCLLFQSAKNVRIIKSVFKTFVLHQRLITTMQYLYLLFIIFVIHYLIVNQISLGFDWDYSKDKWKIVNESEPLWVESNWDSLAVEIFRRGNPTTEALFLTAGIIEFIASLVAVFYAKRYFMRNYKIF